MAAVLAAWTVRSAAAASGADCGSESEEGRRLGTESDRRVTGCYLGLLSSTPAQQDWICHPSQPPLHCDWSQASPLHVHPSMTHDGDTAGSLAPSPPPPPKFIALYRPVVMINCGFQEFLSCVTVVLLGCCCCRRHGGSMLANRLADLEYANARGLVGMADEVI